jgi:4-amino-4-deoxy-L-arabinose transferase-like glycosyltransferase
MTPAARMPLERRLWLWYAAGACAFIPTLWLYAVGEEQIFPITSLEMWYHGEWTSKIIFGADLQHNPLFNWLLIAICHVVGWEWMLQAARGVAIGSTLGSGLVLAWLVNRVFGDRELAAFSAVVHLLIADVALYRGWLAYVDPLFGFLVFSSMACLWVACREQHRGLLAAAVALLAASFLAKTFTAHVFYGVAVFVLLFERTQRRFLLSPASLALHAASFAVVAVWYGVVHAGVGQGTRMFREIVDKLGFTGLVDYVGKLFVYPVETALKLAPASALAAYYAWRRRGTTGPLPAALLTAVAITLLNYLPYWLAPQSHTRYLVPIYPFAALIFAWLIWNARPGSVTTTLRWFAGFLVFKLVLALAVFPYYQQVYRGENHLHAARDIHGMTAGHPLYNLNVTAVGLSVAAHINLWRLPDPPLTFPPGAWTDGYVIHNVPDPQAGQVVRTWRLGGDDLYLLCRGTACSAREQRPF